MKHLGRIMMDVSGLVLTQKEQQQLLKPSVGGVILFSRNFESIEQVKSLIENIRQINQYLLVAIDHEGGRVQRFKQGFTHLPSMRKLGVLYDKNPNQALTQSFSCGFVLAYELLEIGVDFSFAPVLDLNHGNSSIIGDRAFHSNPEIVSALAGRFIEGMHETGMKCVGKHFPGHGFVAADSHLDLPIDNRLMTELLQDIKPFKSLINHGLDAIMPAHVLYPQVDNRPAGFSSKWIKEILQNHLKFTGVIFSDDLSMQGAHFIPDITNRVSASLNNGCDMVLICNHSELVAQVIDQNWGMSQKLLSMQGYHQFKSDKINHHKHLVIIRDLL